MYNCRHLQIRGASRGRRLFKALVYDKLETGECDYPMCCTIAEYLVWHHTLWIDISALYQIGDKPSLTKLEAMGHSFGICDKKVSYFCRDHYKEFLVRRRNGKIVQPRGSHYYYSEEDTELQFAQISDVTYLSMSMVHYRRKVKRRLQVRSKSAILGRNRKIIFDETTHLTLWRRNRVKILERRLSKFGGSKRKILMGLHNNLDWALMSETPEEWYSQLRGVRRKGSSRIRGRISYTLVGRTAYIKTYLKEQVGYDHDDILRTVSIPRFE